MDIPAPVPLSIRPAIAILAGPGLEVFLPECARLERATLLMHELGGEKERTSVGPGELLRRTRERLAKLSPDLAATMERWGAGALVSNAEEAADFATAGFTWFTVELGRVLETRADRMSLEELDSAIVDLEDRGIFREGWHEAYVGKTFETAPGVPQTFADEAVARAAVKFAPAFLLADEVEQAIRSCWHGRGELPDVAVSLAPSSAASTPEEIFFLANELRVRLSGLSPVAPALGHRCELGNETGDLSALGELVSGLASVSWPGGLMLPMGAMEAAGVSSARVLDATDAGRLAVLRNLAARDPQGFRAWMEAAREAFPVVRSGWPISLSEQEARCLPQVEDGELAATFLEQVPGRQLLLSTWRAVRGGELGGLVG